MYVLFVIIAALCAAVEYYYPQSPMETWAAVFAVIAAVTIIVQLTEYAYKLRDESEANHRLERRKLNFIHNTQVCTKSTHPNDARSAENKRVVAIMRERFNSNVGN